MINLNQSILHLKSLSTTPYNHEDHKHILLDMWEKLNPGRELSFKADDGALDSSDWKDIGFQGENPQ